MLKDILYLIPFVFIIWVLLISLFPKMLKELFLGLVFLLVLGIISNHLYPNTIDDPIVHSTQ